MALMGLYIELGYLVILFDKIEALLIPSAFLFLKVWNLILSYSTQAFRNLFNWYIFNTSNLKVIRRLDA